MERDERIDSLLMHLLPEGYDTIINEFEVKNENHFHCILRLPLTTKEEALQWLEDFQRSSLTTWRVDRSYRENTNKIIFKKIFHCERNTRPKPNCNQPHGKHTSCNARLLITVKPFMKQSKDRYIATHPCEIFLRHIHNHPIDPESMAKYQTVPIEVKDIFRNLLNKGHSPSSALEAFRFSLPENGAKNGAEGSICPSKKWVFSFHNEILKRTYQEPSHDELMTSLEAYIEEYNDKCTSVCASVLRANNEIMLAICTPLMRSVHENIVSSGEIMFVESLGLIRNNTRVFLMMCPSPAGALPLGAFITFSEDEETIKNSLLLLQRILPFKAFYGKKSDVGPEQILISDSKNQINGLSSCFTNSEIFVFKFHILQDVMKFLWLNKNGISPNDRAHIYQMFSNILHSESVDDFALNYQAIYQDEITLKYQNVIAYCQDMQRSAPEWALCYRFGMDPGANDINNFCESNFRVVKDKIFSHMKDFNIVQIFHFLVHQVDEYFNKKIVDSINGSIKIEEFFPTKNMETFEVTEVSNTLYTVRNNLTKKEAIVNIDINSCSCAVGTRGAPCKHQFVVTKAFNSLQLTPNLDSQSIAILKKLLPTPVDETAVCKGKLQEIFDNMFSKLDSQPNLFGPAMDRFALVYDNFSDSQKIMAFQNFGNYPGASVLVTETDQDLHFVNSISPQINPLRVHSQPKLIPLPSDSKKQLGSWENPSPKKICNSSSTLSMLLYEPK